jgi:hypothetical protein
MDVKTSPVINTEHNVGMADAVIASGVAWLPHVMEIMRPFPDGYATEEKTQCPTAIRKCIIHERKD